MRTSSLRALAAFLAAVPLVAAAQTGFSFQRPAGLGLKPGAGIALVPADLVFGGQAAGIWQVMPGAGYSLYGGIRETRGVGLRAAESYAGMVWTLGSGWGASFEAGYSADPAFSARRYTLAGQWHTSLGDAKTLSVGIKYRAADPEIRAGAPGETPFAGAGYTLAPMRNAGAAAAGYQLQMSYQYSAAGTIGLALGREIETFTPFPEASGNGSRHFSFTGQHWLTPAWALSYDVMSQDMASPLRLHGLRLGVRYRF